MFDEIKLDGKSFWDYENGFYWYSDVTRFGKAISHCDLYRSILNIPGEIVELGVFKGVSLLRFLSLRELLESEGSRKIIGFDTFAEFPTDGVASGPDQSFIEYFRHSSGMPLSVQQLTKIFQFKGFGNVELVKGNVFDTLGSYLVDNPACRIALLNVDLDVAEPVAYALERLWERVVLGGIVLFDDYGNVPGETAVVDEFVGRNGLRLEKLPYHSSPSFVRKLR